MTQVKVRRTVIYERMRTEQLGGWEIISLGFAVSLRWLLQVSEQLSQAAFLDGFL
jgi:hypothetical protein